MLKKWYNLTVPLSEAFLYKLDKKNEHPGYYLKIHRLSKNLTLSQLAKNIGVLHHTLESIELYNNYPVHDVSIKLAKYFKLETKYFYDMYLEETYQLNIKLKNYIKNNNMNIIQLSRYLSIDRRSISSWINKDKKPSRQSYKKLKEKNII